MIRKAKKADIDAVMKFIDAYWRKGHILGANKEFFMYEHLYGEDVTYVLSVDDDENIEAILGYIPYGKQNRDVMTVLWKVGKASAPMLGIQLLEYLISNCDVRIAASPGINTATIGIYDFLHYLTGKLKQYYRLNRNIREYQIAKIVDDTIPEVHCVDECFFHKYNSFQELEEEFSFSDYYKMNPKPMKEAWYFEKRYFNHPIYQYQIYGVGTAKKATTLLVMREVFAEDHKIIRIVDVLGNYDNLQCITQDIDELVMNNNYEYIDFYEHGLSENLLKNAGFTDRDKTANIIPNYFEPFVQENVDIYFFSTDPEIVLFKADGDQDRPNK